MEEQLNPNPPQAPVAPPSTPYERPRPQWTPPPPPPLPVYDTRKKELLFGLSLLICNIILWDFIIAGGFNLGFSIGAVCVIACSVAYLLSQGYRLNWYNGSLIALSIVIAAAFGRSADGFVKYVMLHFLLLAMNLGLCLMAGQNRWSPAGIASLIDAPNTLFQLGFGGMGAAGRGLNRARKNAGSFGKKGSAVVLGLVAAIPVMAVLIVLLMRADAAFEGLLDLLPETDWREIFTAVILGTLMAWILYCRGVALHRSPKVRSKPHTFKGISALTVNTLLIAVCLVYAVYLISQLAYLSGGFSGILPKGYTMAEYARRGFFEMAWLCAIDLAIIGAGVGLIAKDKKAPLLSRLLCLFIGLVTVFLVATASAKMFLYIGSYGLTRLRVLTEVIMVWLGLSTVLVCLWLFVPKLPYMKAVLLLAMVMGAAVIWTDVDTQVAKYNVRAYQSGALETVDVSHLNDLGPGAVPYLIELTEDDDPLIAEMAMDSLSSVYYEVEDFRDWNLAKIQAVKALEAMRGEKSAETAAYLSEQLVLDVPAAEVLMREGLDDLEEKGQTYLSLRLTDDQAAAFLPQLEAAAAKNGPWHPLPLSDTIYDMLYNRVARYPHFRDDWSANILPTVNSGYYFFLDRHPDAAEPYHEEAFLTREDYHFTVAIYDASDNTLYFLTMDTPAAESL